MGLAIVPGNIKQQMLPFVLSPSSPLNKDGENYKNGTRPQIFTYNTTRGVEDNSGVAFLNFCPKSIKTALNEDMSFKMLYANDTATANTGSLTLSDVINAIPGISIREYLPDTALDQAINFFVDLIKEVMSLFGDDGISTGVQTKKKVDGKEVNMTKEEKQSSFTKLATKLTNVAMYVINYIAGNTGDNNDLVTNFLNGGSGLTSPYNNSVCRRAKYIVDFPYMLYYQLQSCTTTGIYEIPAIPTNKQLYSSDGTKGWDGGNEFRFMPKSLTSIPVIGGLLGKLFGNIGINWMPWWEASSGTGVSEPPVEVTFDLFNDTAKAAHDNFLFVNTLIPNNKWIQYGLFQHAPHLYDVKLDGYNRLFACTGKFDVTFKGTLRDPSDNFYNELLAHVSQSISNPNGFISSLKSEKNIKIPDVYTIKMTFDSLLPANFNQYLYTLVANKKIITEYATTTYKPSTLIDSLSKSLKGLFKGVTDIWDSETKKEQQNESATSTLSS